MVAFIEKVTKEIGQTKVEVTKDPLVADAIAFVEKSYSSEIEGLIKASANKEGGGSETAELLAKIVEAAKSADSETLLDKKVLGKALEAVMFKIIRSNLIEKKVRADGRKIDQIREITMELADAI